MIMYIRQIVKEMRTYGDEYEDRYWAMISVRNIIEQMGIKIDSNDFWKKTNEVID